MKHRPFFPTFSTDTSSHSSLQNSTSKYKFLYSIHTRERQETRLYVVRSLAIASGKILEVAAVVGELHPKSGGGVFCVGNAENGQATSRDVGYATGNKSNSVFQSNGRSEARMVMKTGGRYRRDNIPRGRVSRSRRCQRRQARPRRRRIVAAKPTAPRHLSHSLVPRSRSCVTRVPACVRAPRSTRGTDLSARLSDRSSGHYGTYRPSLMVLIVIDRWTLGSMFPSVFSVCSVLKGRDDLL